MKRKPTLRFARNLCVIAATANAVAALAYGLTGSSAASALFFSFAAGLAASAAIYALPASKFAPVAPPTEHDDEHQSPTSGVMPNIPGITISPNETVKTIKVTPKKPTRKDGKK